MAASQLIVIAQSPAFYSMHCGFAGSWQILVSEQENLGQPQSFQDLMQTL